MEHKARAEPSKPKPKQSDEGRGQTKRGRGADDEGWGGFRNYMDAKNFKLNDQFDKEKKGRTSDIFAGVYIYVNGYTRPSSDELKRIMQAHGGRYETYLRKTRVTHIVASNLPNSKFKMARTMPIVKPDWIVDSVSAGKRLSHVPYLLLGNQSKLQPGLKSFPSVSSLSKSSSTVSASSVASLADAVPSTSATTTGTERVCSSITDGESERNFNSEHYVGVGKLVKSRDLEQKCDGGNDVRVAAQVKMLEKAMVNSRSTEDNAAQSMKPNNGSKSALILSPEKLAIPRVTPQSVSSPRKESSVMAKAGDKGFLEEFYSNSRLHHLSTWGAEFKSYVAELQRAGTSTFPGRERLRQAHIDTVTRTGLAETLHSSRHAVSSRIIMHIDMDCFFVSVGLLSRPDLKGKPVAVTHSKGQGRPPSSSSSLAWEQAEWRKVKDGKLKGEKQARAGTQFDGFDAQTFHSMAEIASCSYEARKAGVKNGMFMGRAMSLCLDLQTIPYNFAEYNRISKILYDLVASYTLDIEAVSCDEMLIDCTDVLTDTGATAMEFARLLRSEIMNKTGCAASTGIGPNILLARLATRKAKPNGQFEVKSSDAKQFIEDQPVSDLPGVGYSMTRKLSKLGVQTCGELQRVPLSVLRREFGPKTGEGLHKFSLGQDDRPVRGDKQRKSVSAEVNYGIRFSKDLDALTFLKELSGEVKRRLDAIQVKGRSITLKLMIRRPDAPQESAKFMGHGICNTINKSSNLPVGTNDEDLISREVISLYRSQKVNAEDVRGPQRDIRAFSTSQFRQALEPTWAKLFPKKGINQALQGQKHVTLTLQEEQWTQRRNQRYP
ncbi:hypothetical protein EGW08_018776 [Elysia chlorotica]|uniref:DNA repair protein REV1 n=1 Tax=Elysia chlorotica TaxID=188477 RepID=A0A433SW21_ELYCH|nr:hypothetical protein EGW08_018776 [Elysia chlorotica]